MSRAFVEMEEKAKDVSELLKTMSHPDRLLVLCKLSEGEVGAGKLQEASTLSQSAFSQHLAVLKKQGLVSSRKESQQVFYNITDLRVTELLTNLHKIFCR
jgi:ArsR family transcriptional regulator